MRGVLLFCFALAACDPLPGTGTDTGDGGAASTGLVAIDADAFCNKIVTTCKDTSLSLAACKKNYAAIRVSQACAAALPSADCAALTGAGSATRKACFPSCTSIGATACNTDGTLSICEQRSIGGVQFFYDCADSCASLAMTYTGTCGLTFEAQASTQAQCWCK
jgi:hypothetical protein